MLMICLEVNQETCLNNAALTPIPSTHILRFIIAVFVLLVTIHDSSKHISAIDTKVSSRSYETYPTKRLCGLIRL